MTHLTETFTHPTDPPVRQRPSRWTPEEDAQLNAFTAQGKTQEEIGAILGKSRSSVNGRIRWLKMTVEDKEHRAAQIRLGRANSTKSRVRRVEETAQREPKPDYVFADAARRALVPRTLTALICGDPAPGWSALDKRRRT